jgi:hypothetical protein
MPHRNDAGTLRLQGSLEIGGVAQDGGPVADQAQIGGRHPRGRGQERLRALQALQHATALATTKVVSPLYLPYGAGLRGSVAGSIRRCICTMK